VRPRPPTAAVWLTAALSIAGPAAAQAVADAPSAASVTIYRDRQIATGDLAELDPSQGLALITETRTVDVPAGRSRIAFRGVADTMVPETVALQGLPGIVVERNEDFDLLSPGSLVERSVGRTVGVVQTPRRGGAVSERRAVIRSGPDGVVLDFDGRMEALGCGGPPTRLVFDAVPQGLGDRPTLSVLADVPRAGRYQVKLSYLATGFTWSADYVAHIRPDGRSLDLFGWLTLSNKSAAGFAQAPTEVVAGQLQRDEATRPPEVEVKELTPACWGQEPPPRVMDAPLAMARFAPAPPNEVQEIVVTSAKRQAVQSELGDYKLYTLPEPTTVAARQTKQVAFLEQTAVPFERVYVYRYYDRDHPADDDQQPPDVVLRLQNKPTAGLGKPLPAGTVSVMEASAAGPVLAGQQALKDTAVGLPVELTLGRAMDVAVAPRTEDESTVGNRAVRSMVVSLSNAKPTPVVLEYREQRGQTDFKVDKSSVRPTTDKGDQVWTLRLAPGQQAQLRYTLSYRTD
jgi:hypothetical protein